MIDDRQLRDYVEDDLSKSARHALEASLPFDAVAQRILGDQLRIHHALQTLAKGNAERARIRRGILDELGIPTQSARPSSWQPAVAATAPPPRGATRSRRKRRRLPLIPMLAAGAAVLATLTFLLWKPEPEPRTIGHLFLMSGDLSVVRNGSPLPHRDGLFLKERDVATLGADSKGTLRLDDGSEIDVVGPAVLVASVAGHDPQAAILLKLDLGVFVASLQPQLRHPITLHTPHAVLAPTGGRFRMRIDSQGTRVSVDRGTLQLILPDGGTHSLQAGDTFLAEPRASLERNAPSFPP